RTIRASRPPRSRRPTARQGFGHARHRRRLLAGDAVARSDLGSDPQRPAVSGAAATVRAIQAGDDSLGGSVGIFVTSFLPADQLMARATLELYESLIDRETTWRP